MTGTDQLKFWRDRPTFVTGGTGLLGSWLTRRLVQRGAKVVCLIRDGAPESGLVRGRTIEGTKVVRGDVRDRDRIERALREFKIVTVFHLAAQAIVGTAKRDPIVTFETNIGGTWSLLEACRNAPTVGEILVASSDKAYGDHNELPCVEEGALEGRHPYEVSKSCADLIAQAYSATYGTPVAIARCGNLFGGGDLNFNRIVPGTIRSVLQREPPVIRSDGRCVRDYLFVDDGVEAYLLLAEKLAAFPELAGHAFNFANESRISVLKLAQRIVQLAGGDHAPRVQNEATSEVHEHYLSLEKSRRLLGWAPRFSLEEGLLRTIDWYRRSFALKPAQPYALES